MDLTQVLLALIAIVSTIVGLVVWIVKRSEARNERTQDAFLSFLKEQLAVHQKYGDGIDDLKDEIKTQTTAIREATDVQRKTAKELGLRLEELGKATTNLCKHTGTNP